MTVDLYYDTDGSGLDGTLITSNLAEGTGMTYPWDTTGVPGDTYYIYGRDANDGFNPEATDYSPGEVTINEPPWTTISQVEGTIENDQNGTNIPSGTTVKIGQWMKVKIRIDTDSGEEQVKAFKLQYSENGGSWSGIGASAPIRPALSSVINDKYALGLPDSGACASGTSANIGGRLRGLGTRAKQSPPGERSRGGLCLVRRWAWDTPSLHPRPEPGVSPESGPSSFVRLSSRVESR